MLVPNSSVARGAALASRVGGSAIGFEHLGGAIRGADVVVAGTGAGNPVLTEAVIRGAIDRRSPDRPLYIVDIAVPRDVEPSVAELDDVVVFDLDELRCIYCGMCEEACLVDAIELTQTYDVVGLTRQEMIFDKQKLLAVYDATIEGKPM